MEPKVEAVAEPGREDPGIEIGIAHDVQTAKRGVVVPSEVVSSQVLTSALSDQPLPSEMSKPACSVKPQARVDIDLGRAERIVARAGVEEIDVLHAGADIRLEPAHAGEVVLRGQGRREDPGVGDLAEIGDGPLAVDLVLGEAAEQLECECWLR